MFSFQPRTNILNSANAFGFGQFKYLLFDKELMTRVKNETFVVKEQSHNQQYFIQQISHPIKDIDLYLVLCNRLKTKNKKDVTQSIKFVCRCVDNIFYPEFDIIRDE